MWTKISSIFFDSWNEKIKMIMKYKHCRLCCVKNITIIVILSSIFNNNRSKSNRYIRIFFFKKLENRKLWRKSREKKSKFHCWWVWWRNSFKWWDNKNNDSDYDADEETHTHEKDGKLYVLHVMIVTTTTILTQTKNYVHGLLQLKNS